MNGDEHVQEVKTEANRLNEIAENRVATLFHLANDHPVIAVLQKICFQRTLKKLKKLSS